jgi:hypothetical protein
MASFFWQRFVIRVRSSYGTTIETGAPAAGSSSLTVMKLSRSEDVRMT